MDVKKQLQQKHDRLDVCRHKYAAAKARKDRTVALQFASEIDELTAQITQLKSHQGEQFSGKAQQLKKMRFQRVLTKAEQADMGKLKKSVRGLIVVHPMTALGKEMKVEKVTGFAATEF